MIMSGIDLWFYTPGLRIEFKFCMTGAFILQNWYMFLFHALTYLSRSLDFYHYVCQAFLPASKRPPKTPFSNG